jgi:hypothetical protein
MRGRNGSWPTVGAMRVKVGLTMMRKSRSKLRRLAGGSAMTCLQSEMPPSVSNLISLHSTCIRDFLFACFYTCLPHTNRTYDSTTSK